MKKIIIAFFVICPALISAQILENIGVKAGGAYASQSWLYKSINLEYRNNYRWGGFGAIGAEFLDNKYLRLNMDLGLIQKGLKEEAIVVNAVGKVIGNQELITRFNYLFTAIAAKLQYRIGSWMPCVFIGPRLDFQLSYETNYNISAFQGDFAKLIFGLNYGLGIQYLNHHSGIGLQVSRHQDLTKVYDQPQSSTNTGLRIRNNAFVFNLVLRYYLKDQNDDTEEIK